MIQDTNFESLLLDHEVEDLVLKPGRLIYFKRGHWHGPLTSPQCQPRELEQLANYLAERASLTLGLTQPTADSFFELTKDHQFRAHVVIPPMVTLGPEVTLRRIAMVRELSLASFFERDADYKTLSEAFQRGDSFLICGATGSGKSTLLSAFLNQLPLETRILILEDSPELPIPNALSTKLLARPNRFGFRAGVEWGLEDLLFESLRMRPDRLILGECRGREARAIYQALGTGHKGFATTIHAGNCREGLRRFLELAQAEDQKSELWDWILTLSLREDGSRFVSEILRTGEA